MRAVKDVYLSVQIRRASLSTLVYGRVRATGASSMALVERRNSFMKSRRKQLRQFSLMPRDLWMERMMRGCDELGFVLV